MRSYRPLSKPWITLITMATSTVLFAANPGTASIADSAFGPGNPFYAESELPFHAPPFDKIKDSDYQPAIEAGIAQQREEVRAITDNPAEPTFDNTFVAMERSGQLLHRVLGAFEGVAGANTNPTLQKVEEIETPKLSALDDSIFLDPKLFQRVAKLYNERDALTLDPEAKRLVEFYYERFVHAGAKLSEADKTELKKLNEEEATLSNAFKNKVLAATKAGAYTTTDQAMLAGLSDAELASASQAAKARNQQGWLIPLQNTTQQPALTQLSNPVARRQIFESSWERAERGDANDTRDTVARLAQLRARKAQLLGYPNYASWKLEDQMARTPAAALKFLDALVPPATAKARSEAGEIQSILHSQRGDAGAGAFLVHPWDWNFYAEQVRKAKYDLDEAQVRPYFELDNVLQNGVFYAANQLYGITFKERHDLPVYHPDVRVFEVFDANGKPLALFYCDYYKRDNKNGGAWMDNFVGQSRLLGTLPVVYNVANLPKPAEGQPGLITFTDVITMFHEFGHALHGMFAAGEYPSLSGANVARDFVEFPSQFNEHWASYPAVLDHYARDYKTGAPMPPELAAKIKKAATFNQGYALTELLAAAELDMQWHTLAADAPLQKPDDFEREAIVKTQLALNEVPPRYRSSYFSHIWGGGYAAGYYAYLWAEMLDDDAFQWFEDHGGLTRANGDRFRQMVLSRGNTQDLATMYAAWLGAQPSTKPMLKDRGLEP
jgi:peptidyl-dipeptidase Dcp